ncbi:MAG TPA: hypothetical protein VMU80_28085 [Bryobacteraceae bacterium]|nr:hypothetical protein [Bryobacteraceae bacterium]HUO33107.1 hypothetical protein [Bryobacteraceae bacterium]
MTFRQTMIWTRIAIAAGLAIGAVSTADAQGFGGKVPEPYTPAPDAKDLKSVLFKWEWAMGMLRGHDERDMVATLEYQGKGTIQVDGQPCTLTKYRASTNYQTFSQRIQYTCTRTNGEPYSNIEVVSGLYAWNEDTPGAEIGPTKGKVVPMAKDVQERLIRIWASPQGAPKAAIAGTTDTFWLGANPGTLFADGVDKVGQTSVAWEEGKPVVTFAIPCVPGAIAKATIDPVKFTADRVVVKQGSTTIEFTYGDYKDWNNPLNRIGGLYAGKLVESRNGAVVRDLTTTVTETGNVYVVAPVPATVKAAIQPTGQIPQGVMAKKEPPVDKSAPTPRLGDHPDLSGNWSWNDWIGNYMTGGGRRRSPWQSADSNRTTNQTEDFELYSPSRFGNLGRPLYKPENWDKVQELDMWTNKYDPVMTCQPLGIPREGPPRRIYQTDHDVTFLYYGGDAGGGYGEYRVIPTDGRQHGKEAQFDITYMGDTVGRWDGDTLVLDSVAFTDQTWFGRGGFFHSDQMHVVERFKREGDAVLYDVTVEDPEVLAAPYVYPTRTMRLNRNPNAGLVRERGNCDVPETGHVTSQIRH